MLFSKTRMKLYVRDLQLRKSEISHCLGPTTANVDLPPRGVLRRPAGNTPWPRTSVHGSATRCSPCGIKALASDVGVRAVTYGQCPPLAPVSGPDFRRTPLCRGESSALLSIRTTKPAIVSLPQSCHCMQNRVAGVQFERLSCTVLY